MTGPPLAVRTLSDLLGYDPSNVVEFTQPERYADA